LAATRLAKISHKNERVHIELMQSLGATRQTSQQSTVAAATCPAGSGAAVDCAGLLDQALGRSRPHHCFASSLLTNCIPILALFFAHHAP